MEITLNECEQRLAKWLALRRHEMNRSAGVKNGKIGPQSNEETDLEGIGAEIAFCRLANVFPDLSLDRRPDFDAVFLGSAVDVKATKYANGHLLAVRGKAEKPADIYALMVGRFPTYKFSGLMPASSLLLQTRVSDFGYGPTYAAKQGELVSVQEWLRDLEQREAASVARG